MGRRSRTALESALAIAAIGAALAMTTGTAHAFHNCGAGVQEVVPQTGTAVGLQTGPVGTAKVCFQAVGTTLPVAGLQEYGSDVTVTVTDPNPASVGQTANVYVLFGGTAYTNHIGTGTTGVEVGTLGSCGSGVGECVSGTTLYWLDLSMQTTKVGASASLHAPTVSPGTNNFVCVSNVCQKESTVSAGSVTLYANSDSGDIEPVCVKLGSTAPACS